MLVKSYAAAVQGISATVITIEVNCTKGIQFFLVGLPDVAVRESHERIISALQVSGYKFPRNRIVINMAPADIRKEGSSYDLPLAIGILAAAEELDASRLGHYMMMGELSLDGSLKPVKGILPIAIKAREEGFKGFIVPKQNAREAAVVNDLDVYGVSTIKEVIEFIAGRRDLEPTVVNTREEFYARQLQFEADLGCTRTGECEACAGSSRRRKPQPDPDRSAGEWQIDARQTSPFHLATFYLAGVARDHQDTFGRRQDRAGHFPDDATSVPFAPSHDFECGDGRWRRFPAAGRDQLGT